jgi:hypothetical protein
MTAAALLVAAALSGAAFSAPGRASGTQGSTLDSFGGTTPVATGVAPRVVPLYRERTLPTRYTLQRVPCASAALGDSSACFAAR